MKIATLQYAGTEQAAIVLSKGYVLIETLNQNQEKQWKTNLLDILNSGQLKEITDWYNHGGKDKLLEMEQVSKGEVKFGPLYREPKKIWGIGINYVEESTEVSDISYSDPVSFMKPDTSIIGPGDFIQIPAGSTNTTAEAELGIVIGKKCYNISEEEAKDYVAGFTTTLDMTEADIHSENPRFLTRAKSFNTFFSFGPYLRTTDEISDIFDLQVSTVLNDEVKCTNFISNMRYNPWFVVAFHSKVMTLLPGDILITGTPGPVVLRDGDVVECRISDFEPLVNPVHKSNG
ncbi:fumarylacetoacetate hydrolase family protein [Halalkalibacter wakoensis JCM 9140]|uniref:Fumarylacetoacetate hydrolase family protein n=1 Tax=Halalkalibacter wakoensis JCM 9140 TaxID=1236970 RepID=W4Q7L0_9BACI|nr:fumarylacetoacetate hydrolase family protein [Halalkalibacter wakoensis]GAE27967.1 fumarylacetoacetate hydrolase family protein [Halalkalibacter wakoensis JCM 9140]